MTRFPAAFLACWMALPTGAQTPVSGLSDADYAAACRAEVGPLPDFSCADGVPVPITVDGAPVSDYTPQMTCDRPSLLDNGPDSDGQCVPYSRILNLSNDRMMVSVMCRQRVIRGAASLEFDEIDVIAHNPASGATCWFQASGSRSRPVDGRQVPSPTGTQAAGFWNPPLEVLNGGCGNCHDNDPFMYSPFVGQVWDRVPQAPFGPYFHVDPGLGFDAWPTATFDLRDNTCLGCHRIGRDQTCASLTAWMTGERTPAGADAAALRYPLSHAMPPGYGQTLESWVNVYADSVRQIRSCCADPDQPSCALTPIPRGHP